MADQSFLDERYFVDEDVYNCPFCNRRHVTYAILGGRVFDWTEEKPCYAYFLECNSCSNRSMHLSFDDINLSRSGTNRQGNYLYKFRLNEEQSNKKLDDHFFYSVPTSFFSLDRRVPRILRELLTEAEGCLKSNFLTGASACARKIVYELAMINGVGNGNYEDRIKALKAEHNDVDSTYFDTLLTIQKVTSSKVHEKAYDSWTAGHVRLILASIREVLHELYVVPALRSDRRKAIVELGEELLEAKPDSSKE